SAEPGTAQESPRNGAQQNSTRPAPLTGRGPVLPLLIQAPGGAGLRFSLEAALTHASLKLSAAQAGPRQGGSFLRVVVGKPPRHAVGGQLQCTSSPERMPGHFRLTAP